MTPILGNDLLQTARVRLRKPRESDLDAIAAWWGDIGFARMLRRGLVYPQTADDLREWVTKDSETFFPFVVETRPEPRLVGLVALSDVQWQSRHARFFVGIDTAEQGKGYASDAVRVLLRYGFQELNLHRIALDVSAYNERALQLYRHLGFTQEATLRETLFRDGQYHDMYIMAMLRHEWDAREAGR
jgi:RimJ/RimL family protein N-acetyltransferase